MIITPGEFDSVFNELTGSEQISYDALLRVSRRVLFGFICKLCRNDTVLAGRQLEEDIMQEVSSRIVKSCIFGFFMRDGRPNYDMEGFEDWIFRIALNVKKDFAKNRRRIEFYELSEDEMPGEGSYEELSLSPAGEERLNRAFNLVLESDSKVYKVITWLFHSIIIIRENATKIEANRILTEKYSEASLSEMFEQLLKQAEIIPWLTVSQENLCRIRSRLEEKLPDGRSFGDCRYCEFYMKKGPAATVSDWINRMNNYIKKEADNI